MYSNNFKSYSMSLFPHQIYALNFIEHLLLCFSLWFLSTLLFFLAFLTSIKLTFVVHVSTFIIRYTISWAFQILNSYLSKVVQDLHIFLGQVIMFLSVFLPFVLYLSHGSTPGLWQDVYSFSIATSEPLCP